jgi:N,N'-diacetyllegionaminate synthase
MNTNKVIVIAEAGVNHNGNYNLAKELALVAKEAGADYVKFQTAIPELVISRFAPKADYQLHFTDKEESQLEMCRAIHLPLSDYKPLSQFCNQIGIKFLSTPFDLISIDTLEELNMDFYKIPSGEITNLPYLRKIAHLRKPVILSTGMSSLQEIKESLNVLTSEGLNKDQIIILHCNTEYPTPYEDVNLRAMMQIQNEFGTKVGYSDHTLGIEVPIAAVALGAVVIEKHFTLDKSMPGPDQKASLDPNELKEMIRAIRNIESAMGNGNKEPSKSEIKNLNIARKSIVASRLIQAGEIFSPENITTKRPGNGISPMNWDTVIGKKAKRSFEPDELIEL